LINVDTDNCDINSEGMEVEQCAVCRIDNNTVSSFLSGKEVLNGTNQANQNN